MMHELILTNGMTTKVDERDWKRYSKVNLYPSKDKNNTYALARWGKTTKHLARLITNAPSGMQVDHINGDSLDNRRSNLRVCTHAENHRNIKKCRTNTGYKGVSFIKSRKRYQSSIGINGKTLFLGYFFDLNKAVEAYNKASEKYHGKYGRKNVTPSVD